MIEIQFTDIDKDENSNGSGGSIANFLEPVSLDELKAHLIITSDDDDVYLNALNTACRQTVEQFCHISLVEKIITLTLESSQVGRTCGPLKFELPEGPVSQVISVEAIPSSGSGISLQNSSDYKLSGSLFKTICIFQAGGQHVIVYKVLYPEVPENLKLAIKNEAAFRYEKRGDASNRYAQQNVGLCESAEYLASFYKREQWQ